VKPRFEVRLGRLGAAVLHPIARRADQLLDHSHVNDEA
jgi:hypothetical protein